MKKSDLVIFELIVNLCNLKDPALAFCQWIICSPGCKLNEPAASQGKQDHSLNTMFLRQELSPEAVVVLI